MNNDKLREAVGKLTDVFFELWGGEGHDQEEYNQVFERILAELTALSPAPEPVDNKALTEAIERLDSGDTYCLLTDSVEVLAALRAAQQEVAELRKDKERLDFIAKHYSNAIHYCCRIDGDKWNSDFNATLDKTMARYKARAAGEGRGTT